MSSNLTWEPENRKKHDLNTQLKFALRKRLGEPVNNRLSREHVSYLEGLVDAGIPEAQKLIDAIEKYEAVVVREEY